MTEVYKPIQPFHLQSAERVHVRPAGLESENFLCATVRLVDTLNGYVTVEFDGTQFPVALPAGDWEYEVLQKPPSAPQVDGLYIRPEEVDEGMNASSLLRRKDAKWSDLLDPARGEIPEEEIPSVVPLRAFATQNVAPTAPSTNTGSFPIPNPNVINEGDPT